MVNERKDDMKEFEEEFDFESEETAHDALPIDDENALDSPTAEEDHSAKQAVVMDRKPSKLPWLIGLAAASFIGWQGYKIIFSSPTKEDLSVAAQTATKKPDKVGVSTTTISAPATMPNKAISTSETAPIDTVKNPDLFTVPPAVVPVQQTSTPLVTKPGQLDTFEENLKKSQERMNQLDSKFSELMDSMGSLNHGMSQVTRELSTINDSVQKLNKDVKTLKTQAQAPLQPTIQLPSYTNTQEPVYNPNKYETNSAGSSQTIAGAAPSMSVHAIIPGRAWLKSKDGSTITVTEGDSLDRYGKVLVIDASNGVVITSSGVTLR